LIKAVSSDPRVRNQGFKQTFFSIKKALMVELAGFDGSLDVETWLFEILVLKQELVAWSQFAQDVSH
jgi:hypothetical protein